MTKQPMFTEQQLDFGLNYALHCLSRGDGTDTAAKIAAREVSWTEGDRSHFEQWVKCQPRFTAAATWHHDRANGK
jgi:hypothetical protein